MFDYLKDNKYELIVSFFVFTNLFPAWFPQWMYYVSFVLILYKMFKYMPMGNAKGTSFFVGFIIFLWLTTIVNNVLDFRLIIFSVILYISMPRDSVEWHQYKCKLLFNVFIGFCCATLANFYAKLNGINQIHEDEYMRAIGRVAEFAGFASFSMWTSCAAALSTIFLTHIAFRADINEKWIRFGSYALILISLYVTMISASRAAFFLSLLCSAMIILLQTKDISGAFRNTIIVGTTALAFTPVLIDNANAMLHKKNGLEITTKNTSRDVLWAERMAEFESSPLIGIGFAAHGIGKNKVVGRNESGGSFISVLAQAGLIGFVFIMLIWSTAIMKPSQIGDDSNFIFIYAGFVFFSIHCIIEGYMFQAGWYLCLIIWLIIGVMIEHKQYGFEYKEENDLEE